MTKLPIQLLLRARRVTHKELAAQIHSSRSHVTQVLNNKAGRGGHTRRKLIPLLTAQELESLGWSP